MMPTTKALPNSSTPDPGLYASLPDAPERVLVLGNALVVVELGSLVTVIVDAPDGPNVLPAVLVTVTTPLPLPVAKIPLESSVITVTEPARVTVTVRPLFDGGSASSALAPAARPAVPVDVKVVVRVMIVV